MASSVRRYTYSNWRAPWGGHPDDDDRKEPEAATAPAAEEGSNQDTGRIGACLYWGIEADTAWRRQRRNGWQGFQAAAALEEVVAVAECGFSDYRAYADHLPRYFRCFP